MESANHQYLPVVLPAKALRTSCCCAVVVSGTMFPKTNQNRQEKKINEARRKLAENFKRQLPPSKMVFVLVMVASSLLALSPMAARGSSSRSRSSSSFVAIILACVGVGEI